MKTPFGTEWHFFIMILVSFLFFLLMIRMVLSKSVFKQQIRTIYFLAFVVVVIGMLMGKYGSNLGLPWWIYYPIPMLMTVLMPPLVLKFHWKQTLYYCMLSILSAPIIHFAFSFFLGWNEYMPFWNIPAAWKLF